MKNFFLYLFMSFLTGCGGHENKQDKNVMPEDLPGLVCFWDFQKSERGDLTSRGPYAYTLEERNGSIERVDDGVFGPRALDLKLGQWLWIRREDCPALNIHGKQEVSMVAWIKRQSDEVWQFIAGMWNERDSLRQYALFTCATKMTDYTTIERVPAQFQVHGYVSDVGGATPGKPYCFSYASGKTKLVKRKWTMIAYTYDHEALKVYVNGGLDKNGNYNPFYWNKPIFDGGKNGAEFTIAQKALPAWPGYPELEEPTSEGGFDGVLGGLAVYARALKDSEIKALYESTMQED